MFFSFNTNETQLYVMVIADMSESNTHETAGKRRISQNLTERKRSTQIKTCMGKKLATFGGHLIDSSGPAYDRQFGSVASVKTNQHSNNLNLRRRQSGPRRSYVMERFIQ
jgi:hypothetical protein